MVKCGFIQTHKFQLLFIKHGNAACSVDFTLVHWSAGLRRIKKYHYYITVAEQVYENLRFFTRKAITPIMRVLF